MKKKSTIKLVKRSLEWNGNNHKPHKLWTREAFNLLTARGPDLALPWSSDDLTLLQMFELLLQDRQQGVGYRALEKGGAATKIFSEPIPRMSKDRPPGRGCATNLYTPDVFFLERYIPLKREIHGRSIRFVALYKADANNVSLVILEEKSDALKSTSVTSPTTSTRYATREFL